MPEAMSEVFASELANRLVGNAFEIGVRTPKHLPGGKGEGEVKGWSMKTSRIETSHHLCLGCMHKPQHVLQLLLWTSPITQFVPSCHLDIEDEEDYAMQGTGLPCCGCRQS